MSDTDVAAVAADDDFDLTSDLAAAFDAAEQADAPAAEVPAETATQTAERLRDEQGRFAKAEEKPAEPIEAKPTEPVKAPVAQAAPVAEQVTPAEEVKPPPGFSPTAKVVWNKDTLDKAEWEAVKRDIAKRNEEVGKGFEKLAEYKPLERYSEMARAGGTTLEKALDNYIGIESELKRDFISGVGRICQNQGVHPVALANAILARHGASSQQDGTGAIPEAHQPAQGVDPATAQRIAALEAKLQQQDQAGVQTEIQRFASDPKHTFFENVKTVMGRLMNSGQAESMEDAYDQACWANKEIRELLIKQQATVSDPSAKVAAANQARAASKSITGTPIPGAGSKGPSSSIEDDVRAAFEASLV